MATLKAGEAVDILPLQAEILESIALARPLDQILEQLCKLSESLVGNSIASVMMYDDTRSHLNVMSAPSLPPEGVSALNGTIPGHGMGSCANAVDTGKPTFVCDVMIDSTWSKVRDIARKFNIGACWSFPVYVNGAVSGSFAITSFEAREPSSLYQQLLKTSAHLAGLAVERAISNETMLISDMVFKSTSEGILVADEDMRVIKSNDAYRALTSLSNDQICGQPMLELISNEDRTRGGIKQALDNEDVWRGEVSCPLNNKDCFPSLVNITRAREAEHGNHRYIAVLSDISLIKASESKLRHLAHHDLLTDLPNRLSFEKVVDNRLQSVSRTNEKFAVLFVDLDDFKQVNDSRGHAVGDLMLKQVAARLKDCVRENDIVARLGGDEFTVLIEYSDVSIVEKLAERIIDRLSQTFHIDGSDYSISASIGIAHAPGHGESHDALLKNADAAMYMAKRLGKSRFHHFSSY